MLDAGELSPVSGGLQVIVCSILDEGIRQTTELCCAIPCVPPRVGIRFLLLLNAGIRSESRIGTGAWGI